MGIKAIYYRCSKDTQDIEHQINSAREYLNCPDFEQFVVFKDEGISGAIDTRPGFLALVEAVAKGGIDTVVMFEASRVSRDMVTMQVFYKLCHKHGTLVDVVGVGVQKYDNAIDQFMVAVNGFVAQAERENTSKRIKSGLKRSRAEDKETMTAEDLKNKWVRFEKGHTKNVGRRKEYDPALTKKIVKLKGRGLGYKLIAEALGIPRSTVYRIYKRAI